MKVTLSEKDFELLVNGEVIIKKIWREKFTLEIALADIGFARMKNLIELAKFKTQRR